MADAQKVDPRTVQRLNALLRGLQAKLLQVGANPPAGVDPRIYAARPWYHNFERLGVPTDFSAHPSTGERLVQAARGAVGKRRIGGQLNQRVKDEQLLPAIRRAIDLHRERYGAVDLFLDLFCADGYYSAWAVKEAGVRKAIGIDLRPDYLEQGRLMAEVLGIADRVEFLLQDVHDMGESPVDVALCAGGLYHITDPERLLGQLRRARVLVTQSIVTTTTEDPGYFVTPAPGWPHGCRFTHAGFRKMLERTGWEVVSDDFSLVDGPINEHSKGSSMFVCARRD